MPYNKISDLPEKVQHVLPKHAQEIYKEAFNHAYDQYQNRVDHEAVSHQVAWTAVKTKYEKSKEGKWIKKKQSK